jgi:hypothetical protein
LAKFLWSFEMKYVVLLSLVFLACGGPDAANNNSTGGTNDGGTGNVVSFGGISSGAVGGLCDPDTHCSTGGAVNANDGAVNGGVHNGGSPNGGTGNVLSQGGSGNVDNSGGKVSTGGALNKGGNVGSGGVVEVAGNGGAAGDGGDAGAGGTCQNTCDNDYLICKTKCNTKQCSYSVRYQCLCDCKTVYEKCVQTTSCDSVTHTCR